MGFCAPLHLVMGFESWGLACCDVSLLALGRGVWRGPTCSHLRLVVGFGMSNAPTRPVLRLDVRFLHAPARALLHFIRRGVLDLSPRSVNLVVGFGMSPLEFGRGV